MIPETIIDQETQAVYTIERDSNQRPTELGHGGTAVVYRGKLKQGSGDKHIAVKIAHSNLAASTLADFRAEQKKITDLRAKTEHVPWAHEGKDPDAPETAILLLELVLSEWRLIERVRAYGGYLTEALALETGCQYAQLLVALHEEVGLTMRGDRKAGDLYWDTQNNRLIILDWNRAQPLPKDGEERSSFVRQDIRIFGHLWAELMLGRSVQTLEEPEIAKDADWLKFSYGTRVVFYRAFTDRAARGYADARQLESEIRKQSERFRKAQTSADELLRDATQTKRATDSEPTPSRRSEMVSDVRSIADLLSRAHLTPAQAAKANELLEWSAGLDQAEASRLAKITSELQRLIEQGQPGVERKTQDEIARIQGTGREDLIALLKLRRWWMTADLAAAGFKGNVAAMGEVIKRVAKVVRDLEDRVDVPLPASSAGLTSLLNTAQQARDSINSALAGLAPDLQERVQSIRSELDVRIGWLGGVLAEHEKRKDEAETHYATTLNKLKELELGDPLQARALRASMEPVDEYIRTLARRFLAMRQEDFTTRVSAIANELPTARDWPDVRERVSQTIQFYNDFVRGSSESEQAVADDLALLNTIAWLDDEFRKPISLRDEIEARARVQSLAQRPKSKEARARLEQFVTAYAKQHLQQIVAEGRWLDELEMGRKLLEALEGLPDDDIKEARQYLDEWAGALKRFGGHSYEEFRTNIRSEPDVLDDILSRAIQFHEKGIELFDRRGLGRDEIEARQVVSLINVRETSRLNARMETLIGEMESLIDGLKARQAEWTRRKAAVESARAQYQKSLATAQTSQLQEQVTHWQALVDRFNTVASELDSTVQQLADLGPKAEAVFAEITRWEKFSDKLNEAVDKVREAAERLGVRHISETLAAGQDAIPTLDQVVQAVYATAGIGAIREFDLTEAEESREKISTCLEKSRGRKTGTSKEARLPALDFLEESIKRLRECGEPTRRLLREWKNALNQAERAKADAPLSAGQLEMLEHAHTNLLKQNLPTDFWTFWAVAELSERHLRHVIPPRPSPQAAEAELRRNKFVDEARRLLAEAPLAELERHLRERAKDDFLTAEDRETLTWWDKRYQDAKRLKDEIDHVERFVNAYLVWQNVPRFVAHQPGYAPILADRAREMLESALISLTSESFTACYTRWSAETAWLGEFVQDNALRSELQDLLRRGREKAEAGREILGSKHPLPPRTLADFVPREPVSETLAISDQPTIAVLPTDISSPPPERLDERMHDAQPETGSPVTTAGDGTGNPQEQG